MIYFIILLQHIIYKFLLNFANLQTVGSFLILNSDFDLLNNYFF